MGGRRKKIVCDIYISRRNYNWKTFFGSFEMKINYILIIAYVLKTFFSPPSHLHFLLLGFSLYIKHLCDLMLIRFYNANRLQQKQLQCTRALLVDLGNIGASISTESAENLSVLHKFSSSFHHRYRAFFIKFQFRVVGFRALNSPSEAVHVYKQFHHALISVSHFLVLVFVISNEGERNFRKELR